MADAAFLALSVLTIGTAIAALELRSLIYGSIATMKINIKPMPAHLRLLSSIFFED